MIIKKSEQKTKAWSGGTTTELWIMPKDSDYKAVNFDYRISTATVDDDYSVFTELQGVKRYIMSLTNAFEIAHDGQWQKLEPFECHMFDGGVKTESRGQLVDFNLMTRNDVEGKLEATALTAGDSIEISTALYVCQGILNIGEHQVEQGDFYVYDGTDEVGLAMEMSVVISITVKS